MDDHRRPRRPWAPILLAVAAGCGGPAAPTAGPAADTAPSLAIGSSPAPEKKADVTTTTATLDGYTFELPEPPNAATDLSRAWVNEATPEGNIRCRNELLATTLEIKDGRLSRNGRDCGPIKPGDRIALSESGVLTVNGQPVQAAAPAAGPAEPPPLEEPRP